MAGLKVKETALLALLSAILLIGQIALGSVSYTHLKSGLTINPYDSKWRNKKLFQEIEEELVKINTVDLASWRQMLKESTLINDLYTKIFQLESYVLTKNIRPENECAAFIMPVSYTHLDVYKRQV